MTPRNTRRGMTVEVIDLPRSAWCVLPPSRWQIALAVAVIAVTVIAWGLRSC